MADRRPGRLRSAALAAAVLIIAQPAVQAAEWDVYANARYGYRVAVPPGFALQREANNGDGARFATSDGRSTLLAFGTPIPDGDFGADARSRIDGEKQDGWSISLDRVTPGRASYSGSKAEAIVYGRGIGLCGGTAAYFRLEYPRRNLKAFNDIVSRMVESFRPSGGCRQSPSTGPSAD